MKKKQDMTALGYRRWELARGLQIVCYVKQGKKHHEATCTFRGESFIGLGESNSKALDNVFDLIKTKL